MRLLKRIGSFAVLLCILALLLPSTAFSEETYAEDLSAQCTYSGDFTVHKSRLTDHDFDTAQRVEKGRTLSVEWSDSVPVASVFLSFFFEPVDYTVIQYDGYGVCLLTEPGVLLYNVLIETLPETRMVSIRAEADECAFCAIYAYGAGAVKDYHPFAPTVEKADYMTFAMHPDDDVLFLGAVYPLYDADRGLTGVSVIMSTRLSNKLQRQRRQEALNGAWAMGLKTQPVFGGFPDIPQAYKDTSIYSFTANDVTRYAVAQIRKYRPEIVITQDLNGEYGHWQHKVLAKGVRTAVTLAADPAYQPGGYPESEPWEVKKLYIHLYGENRLTLDVNRPIAALNGMTAFECATEAFRYHETQIVKDDHHVSTTEYSIAEYGLAYTSVGPDTPGENDMFEHIGPYSLSVTPTPEPTAITAPDPTPVPTQLPTDTPMPLPITAEGETHTPAPAETSAPLSEQKTETDGSTSGTLLLLAGGAVLIALIGVLLLILKRKSRPN